MAKDPFNYHRSKQVAEDLLGSLKEDPSWFRT